MAESFDSLDPALRISLPFGEVRNWDEHVASCQHGRSELSQVGTRVLRNHEPGSTSPRCCSNGYSALKIWSKDIGAHEA